MDEMEQEFWRKVEGVFHASLERSPGTRAAFLDEACGNDSELRREVELLLAKDAQAGSFLEMSPLIANAPAASGSLLGRQFGTYRITALLGAGGMGEVYRAHDSKLGRDVALKTLPAEFARDPERLMHHRQEARILAALNHPNIAAIYDLQEDGTSRFFVMELVEGETLADRIARGPISIEEAVPVAKGICNALDAAHEKGILHRDLKPANIKFARDGSVKVLDFGLAKVSDHIEADLMNSPTKLTASMPGMIVGTAGYMSPEQASGKKSDRGSDVWAFGCVLYEMLTGQRAFDGESVPEIIGRILGTSPDWSRLPAGTPPGLRKLLHRCLQKDRRQRLHDIADARIEIEEAMASPVGAETTAEVAVRKGWRKKLAWPTAGALALIAAALATIMVYRPKERPGPTVHLTAEIGVSANLDTNWGPSAVLSPDGTRLALLAAERGQPNRIYLRSLDQFQATALSGTEGASGPFFSADGQWIGFFAQRQLKKISVQGGPPITLCDAPNDLGGNWGEDDTIVFAQSPAAGGGTLFKISAAGGIPQPLVPLDKQTREFSQRWPQILPGGKAVLFASYKKAGEASTADIVVYSMSSGQRKTIEHGAYARYLSSGHLVYTQNGTVFVVPFDLQRLDATGQPAPVLEDVLSADYNGGAQFSVSATGNLVYVPGSFARQNVAVYWMDREGKFTPLRLTPGDYYNPALSPDGKRLALEIHDRKRSDIWLYEEEGDRLTRLTFAGESNSYPVWTPDGRRIVYTSLDKEGLENLWWIPADGSGNAQRITRSISSIQHARSWRPDGKVLAFRQYNTETSWDVMTLAIEGDEKSGWKSGQPQVFVNSVSYEMEPAFSPDGRWLAYMSSESGKFEVYVRPFPGPGGKWQISNGGGWYPKWSHDGKELLYRGPDNKITAVTYAASGDSFHADKPQPWSPSQLRDHWIGFITYNFDPHPDGKRVVVLKAPGTEDDAVVNKLNIVLNWFQELKQKVRATSR
jgi:Tol biopolymer transport system component